ncbi:hypothetical protein F66182_4946 [Fusarium sp. NRRL 66182]|nr:hypothetical protein F66182_4946 [Fusarium sp. NRRL 66182]
MRGNYPTSIFIGYFPLFNATDDGRTSTSPSAPRKRLEASAVDQILQKRRNLNTPPSASPSSPPLSVSASTASSANCAASFLFAPATLAAQEIDTAPIERISNLPSP